MTHSRRWSCAGWLLILATAILAAAHWPRYPYFWDSYYHLSVIQNFREAGGPALLQTWEAAPEGRVHLYPPLFHLLFLPARMAQIDPILLARFWTWASFPLLLLSVNEVLRRLAGPRPAALALAALLTPYSFFLGSINMVPATLTLIWGMGALLALSRQRGLAAGLFLALAFWTHAGLPWLIALSFLLFGLFSAEHRRAAWTAVGIGLLGGSGWLIHLARHLSEFQLQPRGEDRLLDTPVLFLALGLWGAVCAWKKGGLHRFWVALAIGFLPMAIGYRSRFLATQGIFPLLVLAGFALEQAASRFRRQGIFVGMLALLVLFSPALRTSPAGIRLAWADTSLSALTGLSQPAARGYDTSLFQPRMMRELSREIRLRTPPDQLIFCNLPYVGGLLSVVSERATTNQMLRESADRPIERQIRPARLIVWVKEPDGGIPAGMQEAVLQFHLRPVGETELAYLYLNPAAEGRHRPARAVCPWWGAWGIFLLALGAALKLMR